MIVDASLYAGERDLLELRFSELKDVVDVFLVVEGALTFTGHPRVVKHDWCLKHYEVIHQVVTDFPEATERNPWKREAWQRNSILRGLKTYPDDTIVLVSDADEIPDPEVALILEDIQPGEIYCLGMDWYQFNLNNKVKDVWRGTRICTLGTLRKVYPQGVRNQYTHMLTSMGYHLSWLTDNQAKMESYSHYLDLVKLPGTIQEKVHQHWEREYEQVDGLEHLPQTIQQNSEKWNKYLKETEGEH